MRKRQGHESLQTPMPAERILEHVAKLFNGIGFIVHRRLNCRVLLLKIVSSHPQLDDRRIFPFHKS